MQSTELIRNVFLALEEGAVEFELDGELLGIKKIENEGMFSPIKLILEVKVDQDYNTPEVEILDEYSFEAFWDLYGKKKGKKEKVEEKYSKLPRRTKKKIFEHLPLYKQEQPNKAFRMHPMTYLNNDGWLNEVIEKPQKTTNDDRIKQINNRLSSL